MKLRGPLPASFALDAPFRRGVMPALLGLVAPLAALLWTGGGVLPVRIAIAIAVVLAWQLLFARLRGRAVGPEGVVTAAVVAMLVPPDAPLWQLALALTFGVVLAEQAFGGRGRNFVHPAVAALAFLMFSFTDQDYRAGPDIPLLAVLPALALLVASGQASWRVLVAEAASMGAVVWAQGGDTAGILMSGTVVLALVYLAADPVCSASTDAGRWAYGLLVGVLAGLFAGAGEAFGAVLFAILLASIFAPLIDHVAVALHMRARERRHG